MARAHSTAYLNGEFQPVDQVRISPLDRGFLFGDAIYEVIPIHAGKPLLVDAHIARLSRSLAAIRIENPLAEAQWRELVTKLAAENGDGDMAIYIQVSRGADTGRNHIFPAALAPTVFAMATELPGFDYAEGVAAITLPDERWGRCDIKATALLANVLARQLAQEAGAIEAILLCDGEVTEGAVSSVLIVEHGEIIRRPHDQAVLPGTTTDFVVELARETGLTCHEQAITETRLRAADEVWLTGAVKGIAPVTMLDGQPVGSGTPGPVWQRVSRAFMKKIDE